MDDLSVIDRFMQTFIRYIDSGFGLLGGDVHFLAVTLIGIDVTLSETAPRVPMPWRQALRRSHSPRAASSPRV
jgi:hypothetical protein